MGFSRDTLMFEVIVLAMIGLYNPGINGGISRVSAVHMWQRSTSLLYNQIMCWAIL